MKKLSYIRYVASLFAICVLAGCADDIELPNPAPDIPQELEGYYFVLDNPVMSRSVEYTDDNHSEFTGGELLGCFALDENDNQVPNTKTNACYAVSVVSSEDEAVNGKKVLVPNNPADKLDKGYKKYLFYYPYNKEIKSLDELEKLTHSVKSDQSKHEDYEASDLLWDVAVPNDRFCRVEMDHAMANIIIVIDNVEYDVDKGAFVLGQPITATGIDLTAPTIESMRSNDYKYNVASEQTTYDIPAHHTIYPSSQDHFRVAVPAWRTLKEGTGIIKLFSKETGNPKLFHLKNDVQFEPGKNYIFTLIKKGKPQIEVTDEDSWVLDVLDPDTGEPVGLLCREYLRYQRSQEIDCPTTPKDETGLPVLDSQAWVFYNLQPGTHIPELSKGVVLRFIYDLRINMYDYKFDPFVNNKGGLAWPYPHKYHATETTDGAGNHGFGLYLADHGYRWEYKVDKGYGETGEKIGDYNMHGSTIIWNGNINEITLCILPIREEVVTNEIAKDRGHIAISKDGVFVSYSEIDASSNGNRDMDGCKVGFVIPHYLVDTRKNTYGDIETVRYPLVKIGFNQFWISKSFRGRTFVDGTPLVCHNIINRQYEELVDVKNGYDDPVNAPGYLYPICSHSGCAKEPQNFWDPYSENFGDEDHIMNNPNYNFELIYNHNAFDDKRILPKSVESISEYFRPSFKGYEFLHHYLGYMSIGKMMSNRIQTRDFDTKMETDRAAFMQGKYLKEHDINVYPGNVSGFNLKSFTTYDPYNKWGSDRGEGGAYWLMTDNYDEGVVIALPHSYNCWDKNCMDKSAFYYNKYYTYPVDNNIMKCGLSQGEFNRTCLFAQIRFFLSYINQGTQSQVTSRCTALEKIEKSNRCDIYVAIE